jgi:asparagine synthase (glutamine-hydrolysing)
MCGILGVSPKIETKDFRNALNTLSKRGPNANSFLVLDNCIFGHTRLSIIDLSENANQPMRDISNRYTIIFNGEVYNYKELRNELLKKYDEFKTQSDTEVILIGYKYEGIEFFSKLHGMFAFSIHDSLTEQIILVRDRLGIKPLLYFANSDQLCFSSELKPFKFISNNFNEINYNSIFDLLQTGSIRQPNTILKDVEQLPPGSLLVWQSKKPVIIKNYTFLNCDINTHQSYEQSKIKLRELLENATKLHMVADVEVGCFLSAGVDSTAVLGLMQSQIDKPIHAFSLGFENMPEASNETLIAERTAKRFGAKFTRKIVTENEIVDSFDDFVYSLDQPTIDGFNTYLISKEASKYVKVILTGLGGDELFGGYPHFKSIIDDRSRPKKHYDIILSKLYQYFPNRFTKSSRSRAENLSVTLSMYRSYFNINEITKILKINNNNKYLDQNFEKNLSLSYLEVNNYLLNTLLRDSDVIGMWNSLELRPILLDQDVVDYALSIPDNFKIQGNKLKSIFIDSVSDLLPDEVVNREKTGFELPIVNWMNGILNNRIHELWTTNSANNLFNKKFLNKIKKKTIQKKLLQKDWILVVLISWLEKQKN